MLYRDDIEKARELHHRLLRIERALKLVMETTPENLDLTVGINRRYGDSSRIDFSITQNDAIVILSQQGQDISAQLERLGVRVQTEENTSFLGSAIVGVSNGEDDHRR